ncbi:hypothetical protein cyc_04077 [Cyclospora cayetanensis]|uniref:Uncharacterized protein n=1 Tax=Cyclospora cayetanensis TaxID=88456 RepID=A0A1D3D586_9EIME|nr:hypothetical protein cyc_04077 [Cyclospora cayetanensis]
MELCYALKSSPPLDPRRGVALVGTFKVPTGFLGVHTRSKVRWGTEYIEIPMTLTASGELVGMIPRMPISSAASAED